MAITNAQQYKQLVNPPLDGKRPGDRGDAAYRSKSAQSSTKAGGQGNVGSQASFGGGRDKDNETAPQEYIGGQSYDVIVNDAANKKKREDAKPRRANVGRCCVLATLQNYREELMLLSLQLLLHYLRANGI